MSDDETPSVPKPVDITPVKRPRGNPAWKRGVSGNPSGGIKKLPSDGNAAIYIARYIRTLTDGGAALVEGVLKIAQTAKRDADRLRAYEMLFERLAGKAVDIQAMVHVHAERDQRPHSEIAAGLLEQLIRQLPHASDVVEGVSVAVPVSQPATDPEKPE